MFATASLRWSYRRLLKPFLFRQDPERMHDAFVSIGNHLGHSRLGRGLINCLFHYENLLLWQTIGGVFFPNPVWLAAGFDKDCLLTDIMYDVWFGFVEVWSVTYHPYEGNPQPRLVRLIPDQWLIVNYGLKNKGIKHAIKQLSDRGEFRYPISVSVAKSNCQLTASLTGWIDDYLASLDALEASQAGHQLYTINVSCPNTFGGEPFTSPQSLSQLLTAIDTLSISRPIFIKMPIDLPWDDFKTLLDVIVQHNVCGVVIANLTKKRNWLVSAGTESYKGWISGKPTRDLSLDLIRKTKESYGDRLVIIGVGGIFSVQDAINKINAWANLLQLITGMIFEGPQLIGEIARGIASDLDSWRLNFSGIPHSG